MGVKFSQLKPSKYFGLLHHTPYVNDFQTFNKYLQSYYPTTVLSEKKYDILGVSIYSDPYPTYFQGTRTPNSPGSTPLSCIGNTL